MTQLLSYEWFHALKGTHFWFLLFMPCADIKCTVTFKIQFILFRCFVSINCHEWTVTRTFSYTSLTKPPQLKLFTGRSQGQAYQAMSLPNPMSLYFGFKPINCLRRDSLGCKSIPNWNPGEERKFQPIYAFGR